MKKLFYTALLLVPWQVLAQAPGGNIQGGQPGAAGGGGFKIPNPLGNVTLIGLFETLLEIIMIFAVPIVVLFIIYAGFMYVTAQGAPDKISKAHNALLYAIIGGVLILGANVLIQVIQGTVDAIR